MTYTHCCSLYNDSYRCLTWPYRCYEKLWLTNSCLCIDKTIHGHSSSKACIAYDKYKSYLSLSKYSPEYLRKYHPEYLDSKYWLSLSKYSTEYLTKYHPEYLTLSKYHPRYLPDYLRYGSDYLKYYTGDYLDYKYYTGDYLDYKYLPDYLKYGLDYKDYLKYGLDYKYWPYYGTLYGKCYDTSYRCYAKHHLYRYSDKPWRCYDTLCKCNTDKPCRCLGSPYAYCDKPIEECLKDKYHTRCYRHYYRGLLSDAAYNKLAYRRDFIPNENPLKHFTYRDQSLIQDYVSTLEKLDNLRTTRAEIEELDDDLAARSDLEAARAELAKSYTSQLEVEDIEIPKPRDKQASKKVWTDPGVASNSTPYRGSLASLRLNALRLEERRLLEIRRLQELERLRGPQKHWYELKTPQFCVEARKNNELLSAKKSWSGMREYTEDVWKSRDVSRGDCTF